MAMSMRLKVLGERSEKFRSGILADCLAHYLCSCCTAEGTAQRAGIVDRINVIISVKLPEVLSKTEFSEDFKKS
ncbi:hypothetical protein J6590_011700 [Homalodisca vitripennis]|nr:hypothetical protein J6590_011700 [Homalodisca vitripennis]